MRKKILIAEDEKEVVEFLKRTLEKEGFEVIVAFDGEEARRKIIEENPDALILDIVMPKLDGWQLLEWLRKEKASSIPTIIVSAKDKMEDIKKGYKLEADYYMVKPLEARNLIKAIKTILTFKSYEEGFFK